MWQSFGRNKEADLKGTIGIGMAVFLGIAASGCGVRQVCREVTVEAGQKPQLEGKDFFEGAKKELEEISFDLSQVDSSRVGVYQATAVFRKKEYPVIVRVEDTTPPMVELKGRVAHTGDLDSFDPLELIEGIYDASEYRVEWKVLGTERTPEEPGIYRWALTVTDRYDNVWQEQLLMVLAGEGSRDDGAAVPEEEGSPQEPVAKQGEGSRSEASGSQSEALGSQSGDGADSSGSAQEHVSTPENDPTYYETHLEEGQLAAVNAGYYQVVPDPRYGGYIVMVHGDESAYGTQLIREYLASIGCEAAGGSGDWIDAALDQYAVYVTAGEVRPMGEEADEEWPMLIREHQDRRQSGEG